MPVPTLSPAARTTRIRRSPVAGIEWSEKKIDEVRESLLAQELIEIQMPMKPQYRLCP